MIDCRAILKDAQAQWADVRRCGWDKDRYDPWTFARCLRLAHMRAQLEGKPSSTMTFYEPGEPLVIPEWAVASWRQMIDLAVEDGKMTPERKDICLRALAARVINIGEVIHDGAEPKWKACAR
jgi:hypothetical protein